MRFALIAPVAAAIMFTATPAAAQVRPGMQVKDSAGAVVGTVAAVSDGTVTVRTSKHDIPVPGSSFTLNGNSLLFGMSQAQLDSSYEASMAAASAALVVGAPVKGAGGQAVGTIAEINDSQVVIDVDGSKVALPRTAIAGSANGAVIGLTVDELKAKMGTAN